MKRVHDSRDLQAYSSMSEASESESEEEEVAGVEKEVASEEWANRKNCKGIIVADEEATTRIRMESMHLVAHYEAQMREHAEAFASAAASAAWAAAQLASSCGGGPNHLANSAAASASEAAGSCASQPNSSSNSSTMEPQRKHSRSSTECSNTCTPVRQQQGSAPSSSLYAPAYVSEEPMVPSKKRQPSHFYSQEPAYTVHQPLSPPIVPNWPCYSPYPCPPAPFPLPPPAYPHYPPSPLYPPMPHFQTYSPVIPHIPPPQITNKRRFTSFDETTHPNADNTNNVLHSWRNVRQSLPTNHPVTPSPDHQTSRGTRRRLRPQPQKPAPRNNTNNKKRPPSSHSDSSSIQGKTGIAALYELCSKRHYPPPKFIEKPSSTQTSKPLHFREFQVSVYIQNQEMGRGRGGTKSAARQDAARRALSTLFPHMKFDQNGLSYTHRDNNHEDELTPLLSSQLSFHPIPPTSLQQDNDDSYYSSRGAGAACSLLHALSQVHPQIRSPPSYSFEQMPLNVVTSKRRNFGNHKQEETTKPHRSSFACTASIFLSSHAHHDDDDLAAQPLSSKNKRKTIDDEPPKNTSPPPSNSTTSCPFCSTPTPTTQKSFTAIGTAATKREAKHVASAKLLALLFPSGSGMVQVMKAAEASREKYALHKKLNKHKPKNYQASCACCQGCYAQVWIFLKFQKEE